MAGGAGERFWPLSRKQNPKQLLNLCSDKFSMIEESVNRIVSVIPYDDIFVITNELLINEIRNKCSNIPPSNIIPEPAKKNTAPALALVSAFIEAKYSDLSTSDISIAVLTSDQMISPDEEFVKTNNEALSFAENQSQIVTIGVQPTRPDTGYGYIELPTPFNLKKEIDIEIQPAVHFYEKPTNELAQQYLATGRFVWNSGMFFWRLDVFLNELDKYANPIFLAYNKFLYIISKNKSWLTIPVNKLNEEIIYIFNKLDPISIDYAIMEKSEIVSVCKASFNWDDVGSWTALDRTKEHDELGNITAGNLSLTNCNNSIIMNNCKDKEVIVAGLGLNDMVVIATDDAILITPKSEVQSIRMVVEDISNKYGSKFL
jgi:mannose-1-phosphate guanylyltransferase